MKQNLLIIFLLDGCLSIKKTGRWAIRVNLILALMLSSIAGIVLSADVVFAVEGGSQVAVPQGKNNGLSTPQSSPAHQKETPSSTMEEAKAAYEAKDYSRARSLVKPLAEARNPKAMYVFGFMLRKGKGGDQDEAQGLIWTQRAAENNYVPAMLALAKSAILRPDGEKDWQQGCLWFKQAAKQGSPEGMMATAGCYLDGRGAPGTPEDLVESLAWFIAAERQGETDATAFRKNMESVMAAVDIAHARRKAKTLGKLPRSTPGIISESKIRR